MKIVTHLRILWNLYKTVKKNSSSINQVERQHKNYKEIQPSVSSHEKRHESWSLHFSPYPHTLDIKSDLLWYRLNYCTIKFTLSRECSLELPWGVNALFNFWSSLCFTRTSSDLNSSSLFMTCIRLWCSISFIWSFFLSISALPSRYLSSFSKAFSRAFSVKLIVVDSQLTPEVSKVSSSLSMWSAPAAT